jgi:hypothetical protein
MLSRPADGPIDERVQNPFRWRFELIKISKSDRLKERRAALLH